jgi:hypothetical protein
MEVSHLSDWKEILLAFFAASGLIGIITTAVCKGIAKKVKDVLDNIKKANEEKEAKHEAVCLGLQAILRHELYELYNEWIIGKGYAPISAKEDFLNMYSQYHNLGANGVMDEIKEEFMNAPTSGGEEHDIKAKNRKAD